MARTIREDVDKEMRRLEAAAAQQEEARKAEALRQAEEARRRDEEARQREQEARQRGQQVTKILKKVPKVRDHEAARGLLNEALTLAPGDPRIQTLMRERSGALDNLRVEEQRRAEAREKAAAEEAARLERERLAREEQALRRQAERARQEREAQALRERQEKEVQGEGAFYARNAEATGWRAVRRLRPSLRESRHHMRPSPSSHFSSLLPASHCCEIERPSRSVKPRSLEPASRRRRQDLARRRQCHPRDFRRRLRFPCRLADLSRPQTLRAFRWIGHRILRLERTLDV